MKINTELIEELMSKLELYLSGLSSHGEIRSYAWKFADLSPSEPEPNERLYWSTIFSIIHLADEKHWNDGCTEKSLKELYAELECFKTKL